MDTWEQHNFFIYFPLFVHRLRHRTEVVSHHVPRVVVGHKVAVVLRQMVHGLSARARLRERVLLQELPCLLPGPDAVPEVSGGLQLAVAPRSRSTCATGGISAASRVSIPAFLKDDLALKIRLFLHRVVKAHGNGVTADPSPKALEVENWETMDISGQQVSIMV